MTPGTIGNQSSPNAGTLQANVHDMTRSGDNDTTVVEDKDNGDSPNTDESSTLLVNAASSGPKLPPGDIRRVMSKSSTRTVSMANITYTVSAHQLTKSVSLVDRGANGGVGGDDVCVIKKSSKSVNIRGVDDHQVNDVMLGTVGCVVETNKGPIIAIFHQYALLGKGPTVHSSAQLEYYKNSVNDRSVHVGGLQQVQTVHGYVIPLNIQDGLPRLMLRKYEPHEYLALPHVTMTSETSWDPSVLDHTMARERPPSDLGHVAPVVPIANTGISCPSPPTKAIEQISLVCGETAEHTGAISNGESNQLIPSKAVAAEATISTFHIEMANTVTKDVNGQVLGGSDGMTTKMATTSGDNTKDVVTTDAFMTPMKNVVGKTIHLTSSLKHAQGNGVHQPAPLTAPSILKKNGRYQSQPLFQHILNEVFGRDDESILKRALVQEGFDDFVSLATMDDQDIDELGLFDGEKLIPIDEGDANLIRVFREFVAIRHPHPTSLPYKNWFNLTGKEFALFRFQRYPLLQWEATVAPLPDSNGLSPIPFDAPDDHMDSLEALLFPTVSCHGENGQDGPLQRATADVGDESPRAIASVRLKDVIDQAIQFGKARGFAKTRARLPDPTMAYEGTNPTSIALELDDLLDKAIEFGEAYGTSVRLPDLCHESHKSTKADGVHGDWQVMHTPQPTVPTKPPVTVTKDNAVNALKPSVAANTLGTPIALDYGEYSSAFAPTELSTYHSLPGNTLKRDRQDEEGETTPKVKMRTCDSWCTIASSQDGCPTSTEWGVSIL
jgi:hypothetical protein